MRILLPILLLPALIHAGTNDWPAWRGPDDTGVAAPSANPPTSWSETENLRWKTVLPGEGHATPVVWDGRIYLTCAVPYGDKFEPRPDTAEGAHDNRLVRQRYEFVVLAIDQASGKILWDKIACKARPKEGGHFTGSLASNSPVTDGERVYASFGSRGIYAYQLDGSLAWSRTFGAMETRHAHGEGSSPALHDGILILNWDHEGDSFVVGLDAKSGDEIWRQARNEKTSWSTPIVVDRDGKPQVIIAATLRTRSYDLKTGKVLWECDGLSRNVVASPVADESAVYVSNSYDWQALMAIRWPIAKGDVSKQRAFIPWMLRKNTSYVSSPLLLDGRLYYLSHLSAVMTAVDVKAGEIIEGPFRLTGLNRIFASPGAAAGRIYISDMDGKTAVVQSRPKLKILATNRLDDRFAASPVFSGRDLILRGYQNLYCLAESEEKN